MEGSLGGALRQILCGEGRDDGGAAFGPGEVGEKHAGDGPLQRTARTAGGACAGERQRPRVFEVSNGHPAPPARRLLGPGVRRAPAGRPHAESFREEGTARHPLRARAEVASFLHRASRPGAAAAPAERQLRGESVMQQQQQSQDPVYGRETINGLFVFARSLECIWTLLIREEHGIHYPGLPGLVCGAAILFVAGSSTEPEFILGFAAVWFLFLVARRATAIWKGSPNYSFYAGYPAVLLKLCPFLRTEIRAKNVEPLVSW